VTSPPPSSVAPGGGFSVVVAVEDPLGNVVQTFTGPISVSLGNNPSNATLGGTTTVVVGNSSGVASFTGLTLNQAGSGYTLAATSGTLATTTTSAFAVKAAPATQLVVSTAPPSSATAGTGFGLTVQAQDANGNVDTSYTGNVTLAL